MLSDKKIIYLLLCLGCITISFNVAAIVAAIPAISQDLQLSDIVVSKIIPSYMIPYGIGALIYAPLTRRFSYRMLLGWSMLAYAVFSLLCASNNSMAEFSMGRIGMGLAGGSAIPIGLILIGKFFDKEVRGRLVGGFFGSSFIASIVGIFVSGIASWRWLFYIPAALGVLTGIGILAYRSELIDQCHDRSVSYWRALGKTDIRNVFIYIFIISSLYHGVHNWYGVYLSRIYHLEKFTISFFVMLAAVFGFLGQMLGGVIADKKGRFTACLIGIVILSISTMFLVGVYPVFIVAIIMVLIAVGWTIGHNGVSTVLTDFPDDHRPEIASLNSSIRFISGGAGFQLSSLFVEKSFGLTFLVLGIAMMVSLLFLRKVIPNS